MSEWKNQTLVKLAQNMIKITNLPNAFWAKAIHTTCYLQNMSNSSSLDTITPHKVWAKIKLDINHLQNFRCVAFSHIPNEKC